MVLSIIILGAVLMVFASQYFQGDRYAMLERNARTAAEITAQNYHAFPHIGIIDQRGISEVYELLALAMDVELFFTNVGGTVLYSAGPEGPRARGESIPHDVVSQAISSQFSGTGTLGGFFDETHHVVGVPVHAYGQVIGVVFACANTASQMVFLRELLNMFSISAAVVLFIAFVLIYFITSSIVRPLKEMLSATQSFSQGDFSKRVQVGGYDELGQLAMAFNNMASTLAVTETTRRSFVANVSHELKTPMTTIGGFVDGILDGTIPEEKHGQYLELVSGEVKRLARLVRSMLDTARIETGELNLNPTLFDVSEIMRKTVFNFEQAIEEKNLTLEGLDADKVWVWADIDLMHQVIYNLVDNAVKFVNEGGVVTFNYQTDAQRTFVAIRNTGAGLEKSEVPLLFERFYKSDKSRSLNKSGVGLGLHIVKSIINYHKGEIFVRTAEGEYTEFEVCIPNPPKQIIKEHETKEKAKGEARG
ncbi:MAG: HAMP domain-containing histidine kinase [Oscillospiraceae bacterium]|nr:HAMP domain-containing histidine kinase [Oscillospiraceae bacterium]